MQFVSCKSELQLRMQITNCKLQAAHVRNNFQLSTFNFQLLPSAGLALPPSPFPPLSPGGRPC